MTLWGKYVADHGLVSASSVDLNVMNWSSSIKDLCSGTAIDIGYPTLSITGPPPWMRVFHQDLGGYTGLRYLKFFGLQPQFGMMNQPGLDVQGWRSEQSTHQLSNATRVWPRPRISQGLHATMRTRSLTEMPLSLDFFTWSTVPRSTAKAVTGSGKTSCTEDDSYDTALTLACSTESHDSRASWLLHILSNSSTEKGNVNNATNLCTNGAEKASRKLARDFTRCYQC